MQSQLTSCKDLEIFFHHSGSTRKSNKSVCEFGHLCFTAVHGINHNELCLALMRNFPILQKMGEYPDHLTALFEHSIRNSSHQPHIGSYVNKGDLASGKLLT